VDLVAEAVRLNDSIDEYIAEVAFEKIGQRKIQNGNSFGVIDLGIDFPEGADADLPNQNNVNLFLEKGLFIEIRPKLANAIKIWSPHHLGVPIMPNQRRKRNLGW